MDKVSEAVVDICELTFEEAMEEIEILVRKMESSNLPLQETLAAFERGIRLTRLCQDYLEKAEQRIEYIITTASGDIQLKPLVLDRDDERGRS